MIWQAIAGLVVIVATIVLPLGAIALLWRAFERFPALAVIGIVVGITLFSATAAMMPLWFPGCHYTVTPSGFVWFRCLPTH